KREDKVQQAISFVIAKQTGMWFDGDESRGKTEFCKVEVENAIKMLAFHEENWEKLFDRLGIFPLVITHNELSTDPHTVVKRVAAHMGVA
ncbi:Stf0 sulfotransferase, partial [mine drainage metagenome]